MKILRLIPLSLLSVFALIAAILAPPSVAATTGTTSTVYFNAYVNGTSAVRQPAVVINGTFQYAMSWTPPDSSTRCVVNLRMHNISNGFETYLAHGGTTYGVYRGYIKSVGRSRWVFEASMSATSSAHCRGHDVVYQPQPVIETASAAHRLLTTTTTLTERDYAGAGTTNPPANDVSTISNIWIPGGFHLTQTWDYSGDWTYAPTCTIYTTVHDLTNGYAHTFVSYPSTTGKQDTWISSATTQRWEFVTWTVDSNGSSDPDGYCFSHYLVWRWE